MNRSICQFQRHREDTKTEYRCENEMVYIGYRFGRPYIRLCKNCKKYYEKTTNLCIFYERLYKN